MRQMPRPSRRARWIGLSLSLIAVGMGGAFVMGWGVGPLQRAPQPHSDPMAAELLRADVRADLCTAANAVGVGLRGEYFAEPAQRGKLVLSRVDSVVDFDSLSVRSPSGDIGPKVASVRWSGWVKPPLTGSYQFHADAPGMRVIVAREVVAGNGATSDGKVELAAGRFYPIEVEVANLSAGSAPIRLEWTAPHGARYVVPRPLLHLPSESVTTAPASN